MKIFELHFNTKLREDTAFDSFCYQPENVYEKKLGSLFLAGEMRNVLPQNLRFMDNLASFLKKQYYSLAGKSSPESALKESLKKTNGFLEQITRNGDVSWLGNLDSVIFNLILYRNKWWEINFTKTGTIKILLLRKGEIIDVGKNLEFQDMEPYPLKIFGNIVSGKLSEGDMILVLTRDVFSVFSESDNTTAISRQKSRKGKNPNRLPNVIERIAALSPLNGGNEERSLKEILKIKEKELLKISGICLLCVLTKEVWSEDKKHKIFAFQKEAEKFSILQVFRPAVKRFKALKSKFSKRWIKAKETPKKIIPVKKPKIEPKINPIRNFISNGTKKPGIKISFKKMKNLKKNLILISSLIFCLALGFFIFKGEEQKQLKEDKLTLVAADLNVSQADNFLVLKNEDKAFSLLKEAWQKIMPLTEKKSDIQQEAISLKNSLEEKLTKISKVEKILEPELFFEFDQKEFIPQKMAYFEGNLYFYNIFADNVYKLNQKAEKSVISTGQKFNEASAISNALLFFKEPNLILPLKNDRFSDSLTLKSPYPDFNPSDFASYQSSLYFLDGKKGEIVKYPALISSGKDNPQIWLNPATKKAIDAKSMAVDGNVWLLHKDDTLSRYFGGSFQKSFVLNLFPFPKDLSKISAKSGLLYLLEPVQNRIIVLTASGNILKQFQSEKFDNLKDFAVSENGKTIWILNGQKIYKIQYSAF